MEAQELHMIDNYITGINAKKADTQLGTQGVENAQGTAQKEPDKVQERPSEADQKWVAGKNPFYVEADVAEQDGR